MADVFSRKKRSTVMAAIRSRNTSPELVVRRLISAMGIPFRSHVASLPGRPDIVLPKSQTVLQVKGCFWHGHFCLKGRVPVQNRSYWLNKISGNVKRDRRNEKRLRSLGWSVKTIWECRIRKSSALDLASGVRRLMGITKSTRNTSQLSARQLARVDGTLSELRSRKRG